MPPISPQVLHRASKKTFSHSVQFPTCLYMLVQQRSAPTVSRSASSVHRRLVEMGRHSSLIVLIGRPNSFTSAFVRSGSVAVPLISQTTVT